MSDITHSTARAALLAAFAFTALFSRAGDATDVLERVDDRRPALPMRFDVVQNATEFFFEGPVNDNGIPAKGTPFVTTGYIYPGGTLAAYGASRGIRANGEAEFPELVMGTWTCRGWHLQDGDAETGVVVVTTQTFEFDERLAGGNMVVTDGIELADFNVPFARPITGGTGKFARVGGQMLQTYLDFNGSGGFNMTFAVKIH